MGHECHCVGARESLLLRHASRYQSSMRRLFLFSSSLLVLTACGPANDGPTGVPDASGEGSDASAADTVMRDAVSSEETQEAEAAAACNDLVLDAPAVGLTYDAAAPPAAAGGTITDGTYFVTAQLVYRTASGITIPLGRTKAIIVGTTWQEVSGDPEPGSVNPDRRRTYALATNGTSLTLDRTCPSAAQWQMAGVHARRVLVVDDNRDGAEMISDFLANAGHQVRIANDPSQALSLAGVFRPEIAILDIGLPVMDGYALAHELRGRLGETSPILIALTGYGQDQDRRRSEEAGFALHLVKPVGGAALVQILDELVGR